MKNTIKTLKYIFSLISLNFFTKGGKMGPNKEFTLSLEQTINAS